MSLDERSQLSLRRGTDHLVDHLAAFEDQQSRDAHDPVLLSDVAVGVDVKLVDPRSSLVFVGELIDEGSYRFTWTTPRGPEVD